MEPIVPDWTLSPRVGALMTTRAGGVSTGCYASLNLGAASGDVPACVEENRRRLQTMLPGPPVWLKQVHGIATIDADAARDRAVPEADAAVARRAGTVCAVLVADCMPVLLADDRGEVVAAAHAGWRGLCAGVIESTFAAMRVPADRVSAWLGPAIGPQRYEVGDEVRDAFLAQRAEAAVAFTATRPGHWLFDLYAVARQRLAALGVTRIAGTAHCTHTDGQRFFSYRRDGRTGRMAALIWIRDVDGA